jgi:transglutaminase-like putative cysteine protease
VIYRVTHVTTYDYEDPVSVSHHILRLSPHDSPRQFCRTSAINISPKPNTSTKHVDYFGNTTTCFTLLEPHERLTIEAVSETEVTAGAPPDFEKSPAWEKVRDSLPFDYSSEGLAACQFVFDSTRIKARPELLRYAQESFPSGRPVLEGAFDLMKRIFSDFRFDSKATEVSTPVETFFEKRRGVCQDFAHLQIACMRSLGLPARYVSGYLRTISPPGRPRLIGADASHAWCSVWSPNTGWTDLDPTNNCVPTDSHITVAWGRDYGDVSPVHGVLLGGARHSLDTAVDVQPLDEGERLSPQAH